MAFPDDLKPAERAALSGPVRTLSRAEIEACYGRPQNANGRKD
jgi:hypothetical protein